MRVTARDIWPVLLVSSLLLLSFARTPVAQYYCTTPTGPLASACEASVSSATIAGSSTGPGAYGTVSFNINLADGGSGGAVAGESMCGSGWPVSSDPCPFAIYTPSQASPGVYNPCTNGAGNINLGQVIATGTCDGGTSCSVSDFAGANLAPYVAGIAAAIGNYPLCFSIGITPHTEDPIPAECGGSTYSSCNNGIPSSSGTDCLDYCSSTLSADGYFSVNALLDVQNNPPGAPLTISTSSDLAGGGSAGYTVLQGSQLIVTITGDDSAPVWLEFSNPANPTPYCQYAGIPSSFVTSSFGDPNNPGLITCPSDPSASSQYLLDEGDPGVSNTPNCFLATTQSLTNLASCSGSCKTTTVTINTLEMYPISSPNTNYPGPNYAYNLCGYEGWIPGSSSGPWPVYYTIASFNIVCPITGCGTGSSTPSQAPSTLNSIRAAACSTYYNISFLLLLMAISVALIGAALYAGSSVLPAQSKGVARGYAFGLILAGVVGTVMFVASIFALGFAANVPLANVLSLNGCVPPSGVPVVT